MAELLELWQLVAADLKTSYEGNADTNPFTDTLLTKLTNVEDNATIDLTGAEIKSLLFVLGDTNNLTTDLLNKLNAIEDNATIDLTGSEIKTLLFNVGDTNNFSNTAETKLAGVDPIASLLSNLVAVVAPGTGDDSDDGYGIGSVWIDVTGDEVYQASDVTVGAAVWHNLSGGAGGGDPDQNLWETVSGDTGSTAANIITDTLTIAGGSGISTAMSGDTLTVTATGGAGLPVDDATAVVKGSLDATKLVRIEADGLTTGITRVITMPDSDVNLGTTFATAAQGATADAALPKGGGAMTGAITTNSTFDGIDVGVDVAANTAKVTNATHTGDVTGATALTIAADAVTLDMMSDMATASLLGRNTAATGTVEVLSAATAKTLLAIALTDVSDAGSIASKDFSVQTQVEYDGIGTPDANTLYFNTT